MKQLLTLLLCFYLSTLFSDDYRTEGYQHELSICAIFRDEAPYLKEWIEFHKLVGVEHFYLCNNLSEDDYEAILQPYIDNGEVDVIQWPYVSSSWENWLYEVQASAYEECIKRAQGNTKWLAIIDIDEFLTPICANNVPTILKEYEEFGGVGFNWKLFGHSGLLDLEPNKLLIESLVMCAFKNRSTHLGVKSIVRPECVAGCKHPHYVIYKDGFYHVNANKDPDINPDGMTTGVYYDRLAINHYWSRTGNYIYKKLLRWQAFAPHVKPESWPAYVESMNAVKDHSMQRFVIPLRKQMGLD